MGIFSTRRIIYYYEYLSNKVSTVVCTMFSNIFTFHLLNRLAVTYGVLPSVVPKNKLLLLISPVKCLPHIDINIQQ